jgi:hypothetical protein
VQSQRLQHLDVVEGLPQGVCARGFLKDLTVVEKLRRDRPLSLLKNSVNKLCCEDSRSVVSLRTGGRVPWRNT